MEKQEKFCAYQQVTDLIINQLEKGVIPWQHYLKNAAVNGIPINAVSKKAYRGANVWLLSYQQSLSNKWASYKQFLSLGKQVKKGEKGTQIIFWKMFEKEQKESSTKKEHIPFLKLSTVFNESQTEGFVSIPLEKEDSFNEIDLAEQVIGNFPLGFPKPLESNKGYAFYRPSSDEIYMPSKLDFKSENDYYSTLFHEAGHATGHKSRLNREGITDEVNFGSQIYSKEELVAEMTSAFLCATTGILPATIENSASYINEWLCKLRKDKKLIIQASGHAQKAVDYLTNRGGE